MKKIFNMVIYVLLVSMIFISPVSAATHDSHSHSDEEYNFEVLNHETDSALNAEGDIGLFYIACEGTGQKHLMSGRGTGEVELITGETYIHNLYQCNGCSLGIISASNPFNVPRVKPGKFIIVTLPPGHQADQAYDFTKKGQKYSFTEEKSWTSGFFADVDFVRYR